MQSSIEFAVGHNNIGYVGPKFKDAFYGQSFSERAAPTFQHLPRSMSDAEIESELKPGLCELGDVLAFIKNAPEECKDGNWNLFYFKKFVVVVGWLGGRWFVSAWIRDGGPWRSCRRVFSPATVNFGNSGSSPSDTSSFDPKESVTKQVEAAIVLLKKEGYKITREY